MKAFCLLLVTLAVTSGRGAETKPPAPDEEEAVVRFLADRVSRDPGDILAENRLADLYLQRLRDSGDYRWLRLAGEAADRSLTSVPAPQNASGLAAKVRVEHESHQFEKARQLAVELTQIEPEKSRSFMLLGDALLELGDLDQASQAYREMQQREADPFETETRLARFDLASGRNESARQHFLAALDATRSLSVAPLKLIVWCEIQLGQLAFNTGQWDEAEKQFTAALEVRPGDPRATEHLAELRAAQGKLEESVTLYQQVVAHLPRPEFWQALGDVFSAMGKIEEAGMWHSRARDGFLRDASEGNVHYFHHLAGYFSDSEENPEQAVKWARRDLELRHSAGACDALAWALYRAGDFVLADEAAHRALGHGIKDAHIIFHAGMIALAAGDAARGKQLLAEAAQINPHHNAFHVHR